MSIQNVHNDKRILILGAKGNLGQQLVKAFEKQNQVTAWDKTEVDITDEKLITEKITNLKPDIIINATAYNAVDKCEEDDNEFEIAKKLNGTAVKYLAEIALKIDATLVHYSSDYVFSGDKKEGYTEGDTPNPISNYGKTKLMGEQAILEKKNKLKYYLIRTSKLFNPIIKTPQRGVSTTSKPSFFEIMLKLGKEKNEVKAVNEEVSSFTYTPYLAQTTLEIINAKKKYGIYHIANSDACTWYEAVLELFKIANIQTKVIPVAANEFPRPAKRPQYSVLLNTKLDPLRSYKKALKESLSSQN